ncbi:MAG: AraC family transcriptional regulator [Bacteroidaceae bacterium]|nr:AraC family transcriptional regulator [Bacteroidaceae bacterium]
MYSLSDAWQKMHGGIPYERWDGKMCCLETDADITFRTNRTQGFVAAYTFTLITRGWLKIAYNDIVLVLRRDDLFIYSPGQEITILEASKDYHGLCLMVDEDLALESPTVHDLVNVAYAPIVQLHEPKVSLCRNDAVRMEAKLREIIGYLQSDHLHKGRILQMSFAIFLLDVVNLQAKAVSQGRVSHRSEDIFVGFIHLLPRYFSVHHDIAFYASALNISPVYLSRVVRQVSGRTVVDFINQHLLMEAAYLLRTTSLSVSQIADQLHFADSPSFSKFFLRKKGVTPKDYRNVKQ